MRILGNASDNWTRTYRKYPSSKICFRSALPRRLGWLPISVLSTAQNFGVVMGCTPKRLVKKFQSLPILRKERLSCTTPQEQHTKIPRDY
jgi:hypothetical protein